MKKAYNVRPQRCECGSEMRLNSFIILSGAELSAVIGRKENGLWITVVFKCSSCGKKKKGITKL